MRRRGRQAYGPMQRVHFCCKCAYYLVMKKGRKCEGCKRKDGEAKSLTECPPILA
jgi:hypothetical protein